MRALVLICVSAFAAGAAAQDSRPARSVDEWIRELDAEDFGRRETAMKALAEAGDAARSALLAARESGSLELRLRIERLLAELGVRSAPRAAAGDPALLTIDASDKRVVDVCAMLASKSGYAVKCPEGAEGERMITLSLKDVSFLEALDRTAEAAGCQYFRDFRDRSYVLRPTQEKPGPVAYAGGVRVALTSLSVSRMTRFVGSPQINAFLQARIDAEDRLPVLGVHAPVAVVECTDDQGRKLEPKDGAKPAYVARFDAQRQVHVTAQLTAPESDSKRLTKLKLSIGLVVPVETLEVEVTELYAAPDVARGEGALKVFVDEWQESGETVKVRMSFERPPPSGDVQGGGQLADDQVAFFDRDGKEVLPKTSQIMNAKERTIFSAELPRAAAASVRVTCLRRYAVVPTVVSFADLALP